MKRTLCIVAVCLTLAGCGSKGAYTPKAKKDPVKPATVAEGQEKTLFPAKKGDQWVYSVTAGAQKQDLTLRVLDVVEEGGVRRITMASSSDQGAGQPSQWTVDSTGIYQVSERPDRPFTPPQPLVPFPLRMNEKKTMSGTGPYPLGNLQGPFDLSLTYVGAQEVDTDMGRMSAVAVESTMTWTTDKGKSTAYSITWWAPNIGFVRQRQEISTPEGSIVILMKLKSYSPS